MILCHVSLNIIAHRLVQVIEQAGMLVRVARVSGPRQSLHNFLGATWWYVERFQQPRLALTYGAEVTLT